MEESLILSKFDNLVQSGIVQYDDKQQMINIDGDLRPTLTTAPSQPNADTRKPEKQEGSDISTTGFELGAVDNHLVIVNKFCFARPHLMLITFDGYKRQFEALDESDLNDTWQLLNSPKSDYVAFYNCGPNGGCSRLHKHLQVMPLPANSFAAILDSPEEPETKVPFQWWMIVLPSRRGAINKEAGVNSLGMLGVIAVATTKIDNWVRLGLTESLAELGVSKGI